MHKCFLEWAFKISIRFDERVAKMFPAKRWGMPEDIAKLVAWLVSDEAAWITGQVHDHEGGFRRWTRVKASD